jgi:GNAT superfamily N-acetyltransferase
MDKEAFEKMLKISEEFFGSQSDPDQMPINQESADKLFSLHPDTILYTFDESDNPIGWAVVVPTSMRVMDEFLKKEISERRLLEKAVEEKKFEALYLCAVFILPEYRRRGFAKKLLLDAIQKVSHGKDLELYAWIYSEEGKRLSDVIAKTLGKEIRFRED